MNRHERKSKGRCPIVRRAKQYRDAPRAPPVICLFNLSYETKFKQSCSVYAVGDKRWEPSSVPSSHDQSKHTKIDFHFCKLCYHAKPNFYF